MKVPFKTVNDTPIWLTEDGKFTARINGKDVTKPQISQIEKLITLTLGAVTAYDVDNYSASAPAKREIIGFEKDRARTKDGHLLARYDYCYVLTDVELSLLRDLAKQKREIEEEWQEVIHKLTRLTPSNIDEARKLQK